MTVRALIVDDEPVARRGLRRLLAQDPDVQVVGEASNGAEAVHMIRELRPDLLLLDVQMPELNGFDVLAKVGAGAVPVVVFVTAHEAYALRAFDVQALDYLLKPFDDDRFRTVIARAKRELGKGREGELTRRIEALLAGHRELQSAEPTMSSAPLERILVREGDRALVVQTSRIDWIEAADYYARLHIGQDTHLIGESMADLERKLDPNVFVRVHRSAIVNLGRVQELRLDYRRRHVLVLSSGALVPVSRARRERVERLLGGG